jgi:hypothetical protein
VAANDPLRNFEDLEQPYPGRRKPVGRTPAKETAADDTPVWDDHPAYYVVDGERREFFYIGALAKAIGYSVQAIRLWETGGLMPNTPYRSPRTKAPVAGGRSDKGKRLWTRAQIEGILKLAKKHRVILPGRSGVRNPPTPAFARDVARLFNELVG